MFVSYKMHYNSSSPKQSEPIISLKRLISDNNFTSRQVLLAELLRCKDKIPLLAGSNCLY